MYIYILLCILPNIYANRNYLRPTYNPTHPCITNPTHTPTHNPTHTNPTHTPTHNPTHYMYEPTHTPTHEPTHISTHKPTLNPTHTPSNEPTENIVHGTCFHSSTELTLKNLTKIKIEDAMLGDNIQSANNKFELLYDEIIEIPHKFNKDKTIFIKLILESGKYIYMTPLHLIPLCNNKLTTAENINIGDCIYSIDGKETIIFKEKNILEGVYTVVTNSKYIIVNDIIASPFSMN